MSIQFFPSKAGEIAMVARGVLTSMMSLDAAADLARTMERLLIEDGRKAADAEAAGETMWARMLRAGIDNTADNLAAITEAMEAARDIAGPAADAPAAWIKPLHTAAPGLAESLSQ